MKRNVLTAPPPMPLAEKWLFFFCTAFKSFYLRLKSIVHDMRGWFLISTSTLATWAAFPAFQELINCCAQWVPAAESFNGWSPEGLYWYGKYFEGNMDMVVSFLQALKEIW